MLPSSWRVLLFLLYLMDREAASVGKAGRSACPLGELASAMTNGAICRCTSSIRTCCSHTKPQTKGFWRAHPAEEADVGERLSRHPADALGLGPSRRRRRTGDAGRCLRSTPSSASAPPRDRGQRRQRAKARGQAACRGDVKQCQTTGGGGGGGGGRSGRGGGGGGGGGRRSK